MNVLGNEVSEELNLLRGWAISVHGDCEISMDEIIAKKLYVSSHRYFQKQGAKSYPEFKTLTGAVLNKLAFMQKVSTLFEMELIDKEQFEKLKTLNKLRIDMAHPRSGRYLFYVDKERQKWAYQLMVEVVGFLAEIDISFGVKL